MKMGKWTKNKQGSFDMRLPDYKLTLVHSMAVSVIAKLTTISKGEVIASYADEVIVCVKHLLDELDFHL